MTATAASGAKATATVAGKGDPGYGAAAEMRTPTLPPTLAFAFARRPDVRPEPPPQPGATAKMLAETGLCLSLDAHQEAPGGVLTPWTGLGPLLASRLRRADGGAFMKLGVRGV